MESHPAVSRFTSHLIWWLTAWSWFVQVYCCQQSGGNSKQRTKTGLCWFFSHPNELKKLSEIPKEKRALFERLPLKYRQSSYPQMKRRSPHFNTKSYNLFGPHSNRQECGQMSIWKPWLVRWPYGNPEWSDVAWPLLSAHQQQLLWTSVFVNHIVCISGHSSIPTTITGRTIGNLRQCKIKICTMEARFVH